MSGKRLSDEYLWSRALRRFEQRFVVDKKTGCWKWTAGTNKRSDGKRRGVFAMPRMGRRPQVATRCSWQLYRGPITENAHVLHTCDNPHCVNPEHLYLGTHADNMRDMISRKRHWSVNDPVRVRAHCAAMASHTGETNGSAKLTWPDIDKIRANSSPNKVVAKEYSVHPSLIWMIRTGKIWNKGRPA
jgi:hypothetical protein